MILPDIWSGFLVPVRRGCVSAALNSLDTYPQGRRAASIQQRDRPFALPPSVNAGGECGWTSFAVTCGRKAPDMAEIIIAAGISKTSQITQEVVLIGISGIRKLPQSRGCFARSESDAE